MFWKLDDDPYPPSRCIGRDLLRFFRVLAEGEGPTGEYAILERTSLWNHHGCYREFLVTPCSLLSFRTCRKFQAI